MDITWTKRRGGLFKLLNVRCGNREDAIIKAKKKKNIEALNLLECDFLYEGYMQAFCRKTYFEVLNSSKRTSDKIIKTQFQKLAKKYHPDKTPIDSPTKFQISCSNSIFQRILHCWTTLSNSRDAYVRSGSPFNFNQSEFEPEPEPEPEPEMESDHEIYEMEPEVITIIVSLESIFKSDQTKTVSYKSVRSDGSEGINRLSVPIKRLSGAGMLLSMTACGTIDKITNLQKDIHVFLFIDVPPTMQVVDDVDVHTVAYMNVISAWTGKGSCEVLMPNNERELIPLDKDTYREGDIICLNGMGLRKFKMCNNRFGSRRDTDVIHYGNIYARVKIIYPPLVGNRRLAMFKCFEALTSPDMEKQTNMVQLILGGEPEEESSDEMLF